MAARSRVTGVAEAMAYRVELARKSGLGRTPPLADLPASGPTIRLNGNEYVSFLSNDSLGRAACARWRRTVADCFAAHPPTGTASRLAGGHSQLAAEAERAFARYFGFEECIFFPSGYQANLACLTAILDKDRPTLVDRRIHASMARALPLTKADVRTFAHNDLGRLERRLDEDGSPLQPVVATESLFSMDGDLLDIDGMAELKRSRGFFLVVDEAHAVGALGEGGRGICAARPGTADIVVGTFGKALGFFGAFVLLPKGFTTLFEHLASAVMHSTAVPPAHAAAALRLLEDLPLLDEQRERLADNAAVFRRACETEGVDTRGAAHIVAVPVGDETRAARAGAFLRDHGVLCLAARYPTVPHGDAILRFTVTALHTAEMLRRTAGLVGQALTES